MMEKILLINFDKMFTLVNMVQVPKKINTLQKEGLEKKGILWCLDFILGHW
jgi:hypothetical protein